jgi:probable serine/threonine-protein kinase kinX
MVKHFFLTCSVLLSAAAQTALAKEYDLEGTLVTQNNYVRIQSCNLKNTYALLPGSGNGYEATAEIVSARKNMPESTPIYVALKGKLESSNFLVSGIELIKIGENCHTAKTKSSSPEKAVQKYPSENQQPDLEDKNSKAEPHNPALKPVEAEPAVTEPENLKQTAEEPGTTISVEPAHHSKITQAEDGKKSKDNQYSSDNLLDKQVKTEDAKQADIEKLDRGNATPVDPATLNTSKPNVQSVETPEKVEQPAVDESKAVEESVVEETKSVEQSSMVETPEAVEQPIASESKAAEQPVIVETKTVEQPSEADMPAVVAQPIVDEFKVEQPVDSATAKTVEQSSAVEASKVVQPPVVDEHKVVEQPEEVKAFEQTGASETVHNPIIEETSIETDHRVEEKPFVPEVVTPALSSVEDRVTVFETQPKTDNQESTQLEGIPSVGTQADQLTEATHSTHETFSGTEASAPITDSLSNEVSAQPVYVNHIIVHEDDVAE